MLGRSRPRRFRSSSKRSIAEPARVLIGPGESASTRMRLGPSLAAMYRDVAEIVPVPEPERTVVLQRL